MVDHNAVSMVRKREGGRSRRKCIHKNEINGETVLGHVPKLMALWLTKFLKRPTNKGRAVVKGKHVNRGAGYGLEISCEYCFTGDEFSIQWLKSKLEEQGFLYISSSVVIRFSRTDFGWSKTVDQIYVLLAIVMFVITPDVKSLLLYAAYDLLYSGD